MRQVSYAGQTFVTTDAMAEALVAFAAAIASNASSEPVSVPALDEHWQSMFVDLVIGPASELISVPFDGGDNVLDTAQVVHDLNERTSEFALRKEHPSALPLDEPLPSIDDEI